MGNMKLLREVKSYNFDEEEPSKENDELVD